MIEKVYIEDKKFGINGEEYYTTDDATTIVSLIKQKQIITENWLYDCVGMFWNEEETVFYTYM